MPQAREDAAVLFTQRFGRQPRGAWRAPGRVNLIGEHTDYNEGFVLPFAIGAGLSAAAAQRDDGVLALASRQAPGDDLAVRLDALAPGSVSGWAAYPAGVAWALREAGYPIGGASIAIDSDIPLGAGLSSSAALECAVALTLTELYGLTVPRAQLAAMARRAENDFVGAPDRDHGPVGRAAQPGRARAAAGLPQRHRHRRAARSRRRGPGPAGDRHQGPARAHRRRLRGPPPGLRGRGAGPGRAVAARHHRWLAAGRASTRCCSAGPGTSSRRTTGCW